MANPLSGVEFRSQNPEEGHSLFLYEINVVNCRVNGTKSNIYNYNKNTINTMNTNPFVNLDLNFSPISVEYFEGDENFLEFLTYLLGMSGGIISIIRILNNVIFKLFFKPKTHIQIPTTEMS